MADFDGLRVEVTASAGGPIVVVEGEVDLTNAPAFAEALRIATTLEVSEVLVDLSCVTFMDSTGVGVLVEVARRVAVRIVGSSPTVARVLEVAGLDEVSAAAR